MAFKAIQAARVCRSTALVPALIAILGAVGLLRVEAADRDVFTSEERAHWSLQPRTNAELPAFAAVGDAAWLSNPVDAFVLARLQKADLQPSPHADRRTLIR